MSQTQSLTHSLTHNGTFSFLPCFKMYFCIAELIWSNLPCFITFLFCFKLEDLYKFTLLHVEKTSQLILLKLLCQKLESLILFMSNTQSFIKWEINCDEILRFEDKMHPFDKVIEIECTNQLYYPITIKSLSCFI